MLPLHQGGKFGGTKWTRTTNTLRMKEEDYHCPIVPYKNTLITFLNGGVKSLQPKLHLG
jgi:hypothetical protein